ncbi:hypothetical protein VIGAN_01108800, partial [Vigna angularis var. angularis]
AELSRMFSLATSSSTGWWNRARSIKHWPFLSNSRGLVSDPIVIPMQLSSRRCVKRVTRVKLVVFLRKWRLTLKDFVINISLLLGISC